MSLNTADTSQVSGIPSASERRLLKLKMRLAILMRTLRMPLFLVSAAIILIWVIVMIFAPVIAPFEPTQQGSLPLQSPSAEHWFGTDELGRDVFSRLIWGARISVFFSLIMVMCAMTVGSLIGIISGFFGGWVDEVAMRFVDLFFAFPVIILAMAVAAALGASIQNAVLAGIIVSWPIYARTVRGLVVGMRDSEFVQLSRLSGMSSSRSIRVDIFPSVAGPTVVLATQDVGTAILLLAGLSFLGVGAQPPTPEWGAMISEGVNYMSAWWISVFPGIAILTVALAFNLLGDGLRDLLDPRLKRSMQRS